MGDPGCGRRIVDGKHLTRRALDPLSIDVVWIGSRDCFHTAGHYFLLKSICGRRRQFPRGLAPAVNKEEKRRQTDEKQRAPEHPDLVRDERLNLLRREKRQGDSETCGCESTEAGENQRCFAVTPSCKGIAGGDFQQLAEHVKKGD